MRKILKEVVLGVVFLVDVLATVIWHLVKILLSGGMFYRLVVLGALAWLILGHLEQSKRMEALAQTYALDTMTVNETLKEVSRKHDVKVRRFYGLPPFEER